MARRLNQEAAKTVLYGGMSEEEAWKMVTLNPAKMLHLENRLGSIKVGKDESTSKRFQVTVLRGDLRKIDKASKQSVIWGKSEIKNQFIVKKTDGGWLLSDIK
jgi:predicted amidohydrolase YtcJ